MDAEISRRWPGQASTGRNQLSGCGKNVAAAALKFYDLNLISREAALRSGGRIRYNAFMNIWHGHHHLDRTKLTVTSLQQADAEDRAYWRSKTPEERLSALEIMRQVAFGYDPTTERLQRVLTGPEPLRR